MFFMFYAFVLLFKILVFNLSNIFLSILFFIQIFIKYRDL
jgi:hypothetical protein